MMENNVNDNRSSTKTQRFQGKWNVFSPLLFHETNKRVLAFSVFSVRTVNNINHAATVEHADFYKSQALKTDQQKARNMVRIISDYYLYIDAAVAGSLFDVLQQGGRSVSLNEVSRYTEFLSREIEQRGIRCHVVMDRYKTADFEKCYNDIVKIEQGKIVLLDGKTEDDFVKRFFGSIPIVILKAMDAVEPERWQYHNNRPAFDEGKYLKGMPAN